MSGPAVVYTGDVVCPWRPRPWPTAGCSWRGTRSPRWGPAAGLRADADRSHHLDGVVLLGLVNAHTQVERADAQTLSAPGGVA